ncbi:single-stranded-DNA-specific exonuclease [Pseudomonas nitritireducens]|uniref:Single-stranded-DNA-specific exonuclease RecJ n=1 Tax=Pseudomonas nitroreducens TaxID=46680 RepID=A0A7W7KEF3_PSENT|nr:DHH family phosphoesterase [Pseudomonas nitritireducens]MBB4861332.1 single-stranded-DNA-specific exonuclease [Pseudomonas nitritireducens]
MSQKPIIERTPVAGAQLHEHPLINRILLNRGVTSLTDIEYDLRRLHDPFLLMNMRLATELLEVHIRRRSKIVIIGDFDCDGATSTSIMVEGLRMMYPKSYAGTRTDIQFLIPDRKAHGYGLTPGIVAMAAELEPDLIITVDSGIASFDGATAVAEMYKDDPDGRKCDLLITDHHLPADNGLLPECKTIVNPNQDGCPFPSKSMAGCGVAFSTIMALRTFLREKGYFTEFEMEQPSIGRLLDLVALGTVADVVALDYNNRVLVDAGLKRVRAGHARPGLKALYEIAGKNPEKAVASDFGFAIGPRINAAGRLDDMTLGVNCLLTEDPDEAANYAARLQELNEERKDAEADHVREAMLIIDRHELVNLNGIIVFDETFHPGVVGIVSSRVKDMTNRPNIIMTDTEVATKAREVRDKLVLRGAPKEEIEAATQALLECDIKGSARSIEGVHLKHVLDHIYKKFPGLLGKFGGHAMAAGVGLKYKHLDEFKRVFDSEIGAVVTPEMLAGSVHVDTCDFDPDWLTLEVAEIIRDLGPWGQYFQEPTFYGKFIVHQKRPVGEMKNHLSMKVSLANDPHARQFGAICFKAIKDDGQMPVGDSFEAVFQLSINEFKGMISVQLMLSNLHDPNLALHNQRQEEHAKKVRAAEAQRQQEEQSHRQAMEETILETGEAANTKFRGVAAQTKRRPISQTRLEMQNLLATVTGTNKDSAQF